MNELLNLAQLVIGDLRAQMIPNQQLYRTGNMKSSVTIVAVNEEYVDIVIATDYASYTNTRGRLKGWIERVVDNCCRAYSSNNDVENESIVGNIDYGV